MEVESRGRRHGSEQRRVEAQREKQRPEGITLLHARLGRHRCPKEGHFHDPLARYGVARALGAELHKHGMPVIGLPRAPGAHNVHPMSVPFITATPIRWAAKPTWLPLSKLLPTKRLHVSQSAIGRMPLWYVL